MGFAIHQQICLTNCDDTIVHLGFITVIAIPFLFFFFLTLSF